MTAKPLVTSWSMAAFNACKAHLDETQKLVLQGVGDLAERMDGWFFHTFTAPSGALIRCDATPEQTFWRVSVRLAQLSNDTPRFPEPLQTPENEKYAEFHQIKSALEAQQ